MHLKKRAKITLVHTDRAGNKLYKRYIKTRGAWQFSAKNREGQLVNREGLNRMIRKAKNAGKLSKATTKKLLKKV